MPPHMFLEHSMDSGLQQERWTVFILKTSDTKYLGDFLHQPSLQLPRQQLGVLQFNPDTNY